MSPTSTSSRRWPLSSRCCTSWVIPSTSAPGSGWPRRCSRRGVSPTRGAFLRAPRNSLPLRYNAGLAMSLRIFLLRHAETAWNRERRHQGRIDVALSETGRIQAEAAARELKGLMRLRVAHDDETVCLVTHGIPVRILILEALGLGLDRIWSMHAAPTGISELEFRDDWTALHRMNTLVHLDTALAGR